MWANMRRGEWLRLHYILYIIGMALTEAPTAEDKNRVTRIVAGHRIDIDELPYMVNIRRDGHHHCGGVLVTPQCVLTAAHCTKGARPADFVVRAGITYLDEWRNDVAIFRLDMPLTTGHWMRTIPFSVKAPRPGDSIQVAGWGLTDEAATHPSNQLRQVTLHVLDRSMCKRIYADYRNVTDAMFCATGGTHWKRDACLGDSGGPAIYQGQLLGIVSWGRDRDCARRNSPGVYVNIPHMLPWLDKVLNTYCRH